MGAESDDPRRNAVCRRVDTEGHRPAPEQHAGLAAQSTARIKAIKAEVGPLAKSLRTHGAKNMTAGTVLPFVVASVSSAQKTALEKNSAVQAVFPDEVIPAPTAGIPSEPQVFAPLIPSSSPTPTEGPGICGTATNPESDPEALSAINAPGATALGIDGAGVSTAYIAGDIDATIADFQRNSKYASAGSPTGSPVVTKVNFDGDPAGTPAGEVAGESFLDASSIAAQGNTVYDLSKFVNAAHPLPPDATSRSPARRRARASRGSTCSRTPISRPRRTSSRRSTTRSRTASRC